MANKNSFTPEEWSKILESVTLSGVAVTAADQSGRERIGQVRGDRIRMIRWPD